MHYIHNMWRILKGDIRHLPQVIILTIVSFSIFNFGLGFADAFLPLYLEQFASNYAVIGWLNSIMMIIAVFVLFPLGDLLDRSRHDILGNIARGLYVFIGIAFFAAGQFDSFFLLIVALVFSGVASPLIWTTTAATLRDYSDKQNASLVFGFYSSLRQLLWIAGLGLSLVLFTNLPLHYVFIPMIIMPLISMFFNRKMPDKHHQPVMQAVKEIIFTDKLFVSTVRGLRRFSPEMHWMYFILFLFSTVSLFAIVFIPLYADQLGYNFVDVGIVVLVINIPFLFSFIAAEIADKFERMNNIIAGFFISAIGFILMITLHDSFWELAFFGAIITSGFAIALPSMSSILTVLSPKKSIGVATAFVDVVLYGSFAFFSPIIGELIDQFDWNGLFAIMIWYLCIMGVATFVLKLVFKKRNMIYHMNHPRSKKNPYIL